MTSARPPHPHNSLRKGLFWLFIGIALYFAIPAVWEPGKQVIGLIPAAAGLAHLLYYFLVG